MHASTSSFRIAVASRATSRARIVARESSRGVRASSSSSTTRFCFFSRGQREKRPAPRPSSSDDARRLLLRGRRRGDTAPPPRAKREGKGDRDDGAPDFDASFELSYDTDSIDFGGTMNEGSVDESNDSGDDDPQNNDAPRRAAVRKTYSSFEYAFVRLTLFLTGGFVLTGVVASLTLSALLFTMGMREVAGDAVTAWATNNPVELVTAAVGALDRFLLGMVCLVFGLGSYELFLARSNREGEIRDKRLKKLSWLRVTSIDDLEQKVGEIIVAVMVVNLLEMSLHMKYAVPLDLVWAALAALASAGALALLHWSSGHDKHKGPGGEGSGAGAH